MHWTYIQTPVLLLTDVHRISQNQIRFIKSFDSVSRIQLIPN